jgi:hypothetical protein
MESPMVMPLLIFIVQGGMKISSREEALPFDDNDEVPLGYKTTIVGEF